MGCPILKGHSGNPAANNFAKCNAIVHMVVKMALLKMLHRENVISNSSNKRKIGRCLLTINTPGTTSTRQNSGYLGTSPYGSTRVDWGRASVGSDE